MCSWSKGSIALEITSVFLHVADNKSLSTSFFNVLDMIIFNFSYHHKNTLCSVTVYPEVLRIMPVLCIMC